MLSQDPHNQTGNQLKTIKKIFFKCNPIQTLGRFAFLYIIQHVKIFSCKVGDMLYASYLPNAIFTCHGYVYNYKGIPKNLAKQLNIFIHIYYVMLFN